MKKSQSISEMAYNILKERGGPLHYEEITKQIMKKRKIEGKIPRNIVSSCLIRSSKFKKVTRARDGMYGLAEWEGI